MNGLWLETLSILRNADQRNLNHNNVQTAVQTCRDQGPDVAEVWLVNRVEQVGLRHFVK